LLPPKYFDPAPIRSKQPFTNVDSMAVVPFGRTASFRHRGFLSRQAHPWPRGGIMIEIFVERQPGDAFVGLDTDREERKFDRRARGKAKVAIFPTGRFAAKCIQAA
jgi:hypothetical protein